MKNKIPLAIPNLAGNERKYVNDCIDTGDISYFGKYISKFEKRIVQITKAQYAVACSNATSGLHIALKLCGVGPGDEVIVPTITYIASANAVKYLNADPVFMDCDDYFNIDVKKTAEFLKTKCVITKSGTKNNKTGRMIKAIMPVHVFGNPCDMESIMCLAKKYRLKVVEDASEVLGASYSSGKYKNRFAGTIGDFGVFSFNRNKTVTTGSGGVVVTNSKAMAKKAKYFCSQAKDDRFKYIHNDIGYNYRLTNIQAAIGVAQLENFKRFFDIKKRNYRLYEKLLKPIAQITLIGTPKGTKPNYWFYSILIDKRKYGYSKDELAKFLKSHGVETRPIWHLNHLQKPYLKSENYKIEKALYFHKNVLNLPCSTNLKKNDIEKIVRPIKRFSK
jgi:perosamine synthetase